jgi:hypothetical protein
MNGGRITLQQRLTLNDKEQEDLTIVETLKYLHDKGVIARKESGAPASDIKPEDSPAPQSQLPPVPIKHESSNGLPPIPPPGVDADGHDTKYSGWNLSGFGNTGVRPSE